MMHLLRKTLMLLLICTVLGVLWLAAADRAESSRPLVLKPDGTVHRIDSVASTNDGKPLILQPGSVVSALKSLVAG
jgi:hypothetical protein